MIENDLICTKKAVVQYKAHLKLNKTDIEAFSLMIDEAISHNTSLDTSAGTVADAKRL